MKNIILIISLFSVVILSSCEKVVDIDLKTSESTVVVEGLITDQSGMSYVKLTMSDAYFNAQQAKKVTNAEVKVSDGNTTMNFTQVQPGVYKPDANFAGTTGRTYSLTVTVDGKVFTSQSTLPSVTPIDSITYKYFPENNADGKDSGYYVYASFNEPAGLGNNYKVDLYQNNISKVERPADLILFDDKYIDGRYATDWELPYALEAGDSITLKMYSLDKAGFDFYSAMLDLADAGGLFGKTPANLPTNIKGDAFGYFGASAITVKSVNIK
ncbi:MAG: DUF4249 domain-containing protein [Bacteroidia bacterium]